MASRLKDCEETCLMCFESRPLKIVGNCKHSFCTECLSAVLGSLESCSKVFACPTCKVDCPYPPNGVEGLNDLKRNTDEVQQTVSEQQIKQRSKEHDEKDKTAKEKCKICWHRTKEHVHAANRCAQCDNLCICQACTEAHATNKATEKHIVVPLKREGTNCQEHDSKLNSYCIGCKTAVCSVCIMLDHSDHNIQTLADSIHIRVDKVKNTLGPHEKKLAKVQELEKELTWLKLLTPHIDKQDMLIKEIEDHAQKCIDQIVKWKEDMKNEVKKKFQIIQDIPTCLERVAGEVKRMEATVDRARKILTETEHHPDYIEQLTALQNELKAIQDLGDHRAEKKLGNKLYELHKDNHVFVPEKIATTNGKLATMKMEKHSESKELYRHTLQVDSKDKFIPCVAALGDRFAIAHPVRKGQPSNAIDIYDRQCTLVTTIKDHVHPLYDMSATPDGKLAVLSEGSSQQSCAIKVFDTESGYVGSTPDIKISKPISLGVSIKNQYVILGLNVQGKKLIAVVDKDGALEQEYVINETSDQLDNPDRITCGGRFIFVKGKKQLAGYQFNTTGIKNCYNRVVNYIFTDISATIHDNLFIATLYNERYDLDRYLHTNNTFKWPADGELLIANVAGADKESRVSTKDDRAIVSYGQTFKVYQIAVV